MQDPQGSQRQLSPGREFDRGTSSQAMLHTLGSSPATVAS